MIGGRGWIHHPFIFYLLNQSIEPKLSNRHIPFCRLLESYKPPRPEAFSSTLSFVSFIIFWHNFILCLFSPLLLLLVLIFHRPAPKWEAPSRSPLCWLRLIWTFQRRSHSWESNETGIFYLILYCVVVPGLWRPVNLVRCSIRTRSRTCFLPPTTIRSDLIYR